MDIYKAKQELKFKRIQDMHLRVVNYDRVSTDKEEQKSSIVNQNLFNTRIIKENPNWVYAGSYVDDAITGLSVEKRSGFKQMLHDAKLGKFDLIITKEVPRFARNTLDSIKYVRTLLEWGVGVWFINNNIVSFSEDSEFIFVLMAGQAQEESRRISSRVKFGHRQSIKRGHILGTDNMYGFKKKNCVLEVDEKTKSMIQYIFTQYATGETSSHKLADELYSLGYRNRNGGKISSRTITNIIRNEKYKGYFVGGKVVIEDMITKKQRFIDSHEWIRFKDEKGDIVPALVSEDVWNQANEVLEARSKALFSERKTSYKTDNLFTGKIVCTQDGATYWLRARGKKENRHDLIWECSMHKTHGAKSCPSFAIYEKDLIELVTDIVDKELGNLSEVVDEYIEMLKNILNHDDSAQEVLMLNKELTSVKRKRGKLLDLNLSEHLSDEDFYEKDNELKSIQENIEQSLSKLNRLDSEKELQNIISSIRKHVNKISKITSEDITKQNINLLFDKIYAKPIGNNTMNLTFVLNMGYDVGRIYSRHRKNRNGENMCRSENMLKKMIEQQEKQMAGK